MNNISNGGAVNLKWQLVYIALLLSGLLFKFTFSYSDGIVIIRTRIMIWVCNICGDHNLMDVPRQVTTLSE